MIMLKKYQSYVKRIGLLTGIVYFFAGVAIFVFFLDDIPVLSILGVILAVFFAIRIFIRFK